MAAQAAAASMQPTHKHAAQADPAPAYRTISTQSASPTRSCRQCPSTQHRTSPFCLRLHNLPLPQPRNRHTRSPTHSNSQATANMQPPPLSRHQSHDQQPPQHQHQHTQQQHQHHPLPQQHPQRDSALPAAYAGLTPQHQSIIRHRSPASRILTVTCQQSATRLLWQRAENERCATAQHQHTPATPASIPAPAASAVDVACRCRCQSRRSPALVRAIAQPRAVQWADSSRRFQHPSLALALPQHRHCTCHWPVSYSSLLSAAGRLASARARLCLLYFVIYR